MWLRLHVITEETGGRGSNRDYRGILRAEAVTLCNAITAGLHAASHRRVLREDRTEDTVNRSFGTILCLEKSGEGGAILPNQKEFEYRDNNPGPKGSRLRRHQSVEG